MNRLITRPLLMLSASGLALAVVAAPVKVSAAEVDEDDVAARVCPTGATLMDADDVEDDDRADATVFVYETAGVGDAPDVLCTFAVVSTDDDSTLDGSYTLSVGPARTSGAVPRSGGATGAVISDAAQSPEVVFAAGGQRTTVDVTKASTSTRKKAAKALATSKKKAKKAYVKAGRTKAARTTMKRRISVATKKYRAAVAPRTTVSRVTYRLDLTLPLDATDDQP